MSPTQECGPFGAERHSGIKRSAATGKWEVGTTPDVLRRFALIRTHVEKSGCGWPGRGVERRRGLTSISDVPQARPYQNSTYDKSIGWMAARVPNSPAVGEYLQNQQINRRISPVEDPSGHLPAVTTSLQAVFDSASMV